MTATSILKSWEVIPNRDIKTAWIAAPNTTDSGNTLAITLADHGINPTGLLTVDVHEHQTDGSVIVNEAVTTAVSAGVLTVTFVAGTDDFRMIEIRGRGDPGAFS